MSFGTQTTSGETVTVQSVSLPSDGYVAIHDIKKGQNDPTGTVIGVSDYLEAGTYKNVPVGLFEVPGGNFSLKRLQKSQTLSAIPHQETTGNRMFDFVLRNSAGDVPYTDAASGSIIVDTAYITVQARSNATANAQANLTGTATTLSAAGDRSGTDKKANLTSHHLIDEE